MGNMKVSDSTYAVGSIMAAVQHHKAVFFKPEPSHVFLHPLDAEEWFGTYPIEVMGLKVGAGPRCAPRIFHLGNRVRPGPQMSIFRCEDRMWRSHVCVRCGREDVIEDVIITRYLCSACSKASLEGRAYAPDLRESVR